MEKYSFTEENYLKAVFFLGQHSQKGVSTNAIAQRLETKASTVTDMIRKLSDKGLLQYKKYQGVKLTDSGKEVAIRTVRKHRLWEVFLVNNLDFGWEEVHEIAEQLEHIQSNKLTNKLDAYLGYPKYDPHGDPIPDKKGIFPKRADLTLEECKAGSQVIVQGVKDTSPEFLKYLEKLNISLGDEIEVVELEEFDRSMSIVHRTENKNLSAQVCANIYIKKL